MSFFVDLSESPYHSAGSRRWRPPVRRSYARQSVGRPPTTTDHRLATVATSEPKMLKHSKWISSITPQHITYDHAIT